MPKGQPISQEIKSQIVPLYKTGISQMEVADRLGISQNVVSRTIRSSGYDRFHVGGAMARSTPIANCEPKKELPPEPRSKLRAVSRSLKLKSDITGFTYSISTDSDIVVIESEAALMEIRVSQLKGFIQELESITEHFKSPS